MSTAAPCFVDNLVPLQKINDMPPEDRPREKLLERGASSLSDQELLAILLGGGTNKQPLHRLSNKILTSLDRSSGVPDVVDLQQVDGIGPAKAALLAAAHEFARRRIRPGNEKINKPADLVALIRHYADRPQEHFLCASLNGANEVLDIRLVTIGLVNQSQIHPREVFAGPLTDRATSVVVAHNHPSGNLTPSHSDLTATNTLAEAGKTLGIKLLDHIIFTSKGYFSFRESGLLNEG